jgi:alkylhydroperoxidase/carboxymuconolactone decarboxylase family protein YurZ
MRMAWDDTGAMTDRSFDLMAAARAVSPALGAGIGRIYDALRTDGALPAGAKAVHMAFAHAALDQRPLLARELDRAVSLGVAGEFVASASVLLLLTRGETAFREFTLAARERFTPEPAEGDAPESTVELALDYFREHFGGEVSYRQVLFAELAPESFAGYQLMHRGALHDNRIETVQGELLLCTVLAAEYAFDLLDVHITGARAAGASEEAIAESLLCAVPASGLTAWAGGSGALLRTRV